MRVTTKIWSSVFCATFAVTTTGTLRAAEGLRLLPSSAQSQGRIGGRIADLHDPSAAWAHPARLAALDSGVIQGSLSIWHGATDFQRIDGRRDSMQDPWKQTGSLSAAFPLNDSGLTAGLFVGSTHGSSVDWPRDGIFSYVTAFTSQLTAVSVTPAVAWKAKGNLSFGLALDVTRAEVSFKQDYPWFLATGDPRTRDGLQTIEGDGLGVGAVSSVSWEPRPGHVIGLVGRLPISVDLEGRYRVTNRPATYGSVPSRNHFASEIEFPPSVALGYAVALRENLTLGFDVEWVGTSSHDDLPIEIGTSQSFVPNQPVPLAWEDSLSFGVGLEWQATPVWTFRAGWLHTNSPMPDRTFTPLVPFNDRDLFSVGVGYQRGRHEVNLAYVFGLYPDREVRGNVEPGFDGDYSFEWHLMTLSYGIKF